MQGELDREETGEIRGRHLAAVRSGQRAVEVHRTPGVDGLACGQGDLVLHGPALSGYDGAAGQRTELNQRAHQVVEEVVGVEVLARCRLRTVLRAEKAQDRLYGGQDRFRGCHRVEVLGDPRELVGSRFPHGRDLLQALEVVLPALGVLLGLLLVQSLVGQGHLGPVRCRLDHDGHRRGPRRERLVLVPAEGEHQAPSWLDLADGAGGVVPGGDGPAEVAACAEIDVRRDGEPAADPLRLGDERERLVGGHGQQHGLVEAHLFLLSCSASSTSESSSSVQNRLISACSFCSPDGRTR